MSLLARLADGVLGPCIPPEQLPHPVPDGVRVRRNRGIPRLGSWFMGRGRMAAAVTLGRTILVNAETELTDDLLVHELVHVRQWQDPLFPLKYVLASIRHGYRGNPYEQEAYGRQREFAARHHPDARHT